MSVTRWHKSSGVSLQATRLKKAKDKWMAAEKLINESVMCRAGSDKRVLVSAFNVIFGSILAELLTLFAC